MWFYLPLLAIGLLPASILLWSFLRFMFSADEDVYHKDWDMYFDTIVMMSTASLLVHDDETWASLRKAEPMFLSEADYVFSVAGLERWYGPIP